MHSRFLLKIIYGFLLTLSLSKHHCEADESPGFFLKITKNVPRLGRRSDSYFLKNMKTVPRIGRRDEEFAASTDPLPLAKRMLLSPAAAAAAAEREYSLVQPVTSNTLIELLTKNALPTDNIKFIHWKDFDRALQMDNDLYNKVISLGRRPDERLKEDIGIDMNNGFMPQLTHANNNNYGYYNKDLGDFYSSRDGGDYFNQL